MEMLLINGGQKLEGSARISGSKNSALPIMIAGLLSNQESIIKNVPDLADTRFLVELLKSFGAQCLKMSDGLTISCPNVENYVAQYDVVRKMRASVLVLAPLLARTGRAVVSLPGGCAIGTRPVDIHLEGLRRLGADVEVKDGYIHATLKSGGFVGGEFELPMPSVGATENLLMAAVLASGTTVLRRVAREPEVVELCEALNGAGAKISGIGSSELTIKGVSSLRGINHKIKPDRVEAGTFIAIAAATKSSLLLNDVILADIANVMECFAMAGVSFSPMPTSSLGLNNLMVVAPERLKAVDIETAAYPGFPTDMQAQFMAAMTLADGTSNIYERIFENRMMHVPELRRMGAEIYLKNGIARVVGRENLNGAPVMATDLRASASLVIAALAANGKSEIRRIYHLDRGYEDLASKLESLKANVKRCQQKL